MEAPKVSGKQESSRLTVYIHPVGVSVPWNLTEPPFSAGLAAVARVHDRICWSWGQCLVLGRARPDYKVSTSQGSLIACMNVAWHGSEYCG